MTLLFFTFAGAIAPAQSVESRIDLPSAPEPISQNLSSFMPSNTAFSQNAPKPADKPADENTPTDPPGAPALTMFPHPEDARYWLSGQANIIFQGRLPFHSLYQGTNSFRNSAEYKTSMVGTAYAALRRNQSVRYNTDFIFDVESAAGRGLSEALGLAGFTNLDVVRNPNLGSTPYIARYEIHQVIGLTDKTIAQEANFFAVASTVPARRVELRVGKMTLPDFFDVNSVGSDSHLQFMNWTADNNGAWDYAADTRGYTVGGMAEYDDRSWSIRYGLFAMPVVANGIDMDWAFSRAHGHNGEFELRHSWVLQRKGMSRLLFYANRAHMGSYREAVNAFLAGTDQTPNIIAHEHLGALKYGFGYNTEQELTANLRVFGRFGWNEGQHESFAYTEVDQTVEIGADYTGNRWHRSQDKLAIVLVSNAIKRDHQNYLRLGGLGFLLGDGNLNYGRENIVESYYSWHAWKGMFYSADVQHIDNPGYNRDRGPAWVGSVRTHVDF
ncbi:carbohydrate porin [Telmatobacter sp. DSM 110680]|uniref:Carbohydrate porin n=1 Tax=Telmatobacter sp. DSM 110680 TaxID=3036704 RepID=A0AAU7DQQ9_9BACT